MAHLAREIEEIVLLLHEEVHRPLRAYIGDIDAQALLDARDVAPVAAEAGEQGIDQQDVRAHINEPTRQVRADEAEATRDHHMLARVNFFVRRGRTYRAILRRL